MKFSPLFGAALLGLSLSFSARAQTPIVGTPSTMSTPGAPTTPVVGAGTMVPGQPGTVIGTGTLPTGTTTPIGTSGTTMSPNGLPARTIDGGTLRTDQPLGSPTTPGPQSTRRPNSRTRTTTGTAVRP